MAFFDPFTDTPEDWGFSVNDLGSMREWIEGADEAGPQIMVHAIGDRAIRDLFEIYSAVTRRTLDGENPNGWIPEQKIAVEQALRAYTDQGAFASFEEHRKGMLKVGMLADMVLVDPDLTEVSPETIWDAEVVVTIVGGAWCSSEKPTGNGRVVRARREVPAPGPTALGSLRCTRIPS